MGKGDGDSGRELLPKTLPHNSSHFVFIANEGKEREQKRRSRGGGVELPL